MGKYSATEQRKRKAKIDEAKEKISTLYHLKEAGTITEDQYCLQRIPHLEVLGTRHMYDSTGHLL